MGDQTARAARRTPCSCVRMGPPPPGRQCAACAFEARQHGCRARSGTFFRGGCRTYKLHCENAGTALPYLLGRSAPAFSKSLADLPKSLAVFFEILGKLSPGSDLTLLDNLLYWRAIFILRSAK